MTLRIAVTGARGRLGRELVSLDWGAAHLEAWSREDGDLSDWHAVDALVQGVDVVVHTAASTDLVRCETDRQYAWDNVALPAIHVARACASRSIHLLHVSTDYVFSGDEPVHPIPPATRPDPLNYYATCKVAAESAARAVPSHCVLRTTLKSRGPWKHPQAPADMWLSHTYYDEAAQVVRQLALSRRQGLVQYGARDVNVLDFARRDRPDVRAVTRADIKTMRLPGDIRMEKNL